MKLRLDGQNLAVRDYFTPFNQKVLDAKDRDLGSQGPVLLPPQAGPHPHLLVVTGKAGKLYVLDRDKLGKFQEGVDSQIVQSIKVKDAYGAVAYWNGHIFFTDRSCVTRDFAIENGMLVAKGMTQRMSSPGGNSDRFCRWHEGRDSVGSVDEGVERNAHGQARSAACIRCQGYHA